MPDVSSGVIDFFLHPPLGLLHATLDANGPYSGNVTITEMDLPILGVSHTVSVSDIYGVVVQLNGAIPAGWGYRLGWVSPSGQLDGAEYDERLVQIAVVHTFLVGFSNISQLVDVYTFPELVMFSQAAPTALGLLVAPGLSVDLFGIRLLP